MEEMVYCRGEMWCGLFDKDYIQMLWFYVIDFYVIQ